jgi:hypothetical protein
MQESSYIINNVQQPLENIICVKKTQPGFSTQTIMFKRRRTRKISSVGNETAKLLLLNWQKVFGSQYSNQPRQ